MNAPVAPSENRESVVRAMSGWLMLMVVLVCYAAAIFLLVRDVHSVVGVTTATVVLLVAGLLWLGFFTLQPNEARVLILFGAYKGTVRDSGFFFTNPLNKKLKISLRARNLTGEKLKVNDKRGNPIDIAAVVVWRVKD